MKLPKIRKCQHKGYKYQVGRDGTEDGGLQQKQDGKQSNYGFGI